jgi:3-dehydroquinate dehydratase II
VKNRIGVMHGVNLDVLERRDPEHYGGLSFAQLELRVKRFAHELGLEATFSQTNHEGVFCELLHRAPQMADALLLNPGAWTHYSYAIRDALEVAGLPAVEVHLSAIDGRDEWRRQSVIRDLCLGAVAGKGVEGYRDALELLRGELERRVAS